MEVFVIAAIGGNLKKLTNFLILIVKSFLRLIILDEIHNTILLITLLHAHYNKSYIKRQTIAAISLFRIAFNRVIFSLENKKRKSAIHAIPFISVMPNRIFLC